MSDLVMINGGKPTTTSRLIAEAFGKQHKNVIQNIDKLECSEDFSRLNFQPADYTDNQGKKRPEYIITRDGFTFLAMGFTGTRAAKFKEEFITAFNVMEETLKVTGPEPKSEDLLLLQAMNILNNRIAQKEIELTQAKETIIKQAPSVQYVKDVLQSESCFLTNTIAKELGMSAVSLNRLLKSMGVQYYSDGHWVLYSKHQNKEYTKTRSHTHTDTDGSKRSTISTVWTEKGRAFIHSLLNPPLSAAVMAKNNSPVPVTSLRR